ncbi:MAG: DUF2461 domain-containing protein, partial [Jiangellaceae bacterium]
VEALDFYEGLEIENSKSYWTAHKQVYEAAVHAPLVALAEELSPEFGPVRVFRPYRDVRFAADKSPYKTHQGVTVGDHYVHVSAAGLFVAVGYYRMATDQLAQYRESVDDDHAGPELERRVARLRELGYIVGGDLLKTRPRGYPADHPRLELLRHRSIAGWLEVGAPAWVHTSEAVAHVAKAWRELEPLQQWLDEHVGPSADTSR